MKPFRLRWKGFFVKMRIKNIFWIEVVIFDTFGVLV